MYNSPNHIRFANQAADNAQCNCIMYSLIEASPHYVSPMHTLLRLGNILFVNKR